MKRIKQKITICLIIFIFALSSPSNIFAQVCNPADALPNHGCPVGTTCRLDSKSTPPQNKCQSNSAEIVPGEGVDIGQWFNLNFSSKAPTSVGGFVSGLLSQVYVVVMILTLVYLIWGSYRYMISGGDPKAVAAARSHLTWAIVGTIIVYISYFVFQLLNVLLLKVYS